MDLRMQISPSQRMQMVLKGLNPLNEKDVRGFLSGSIGQGEKLERAKTLIGEDAFNNTNLGHSKHSEREGPNLDGSISKVSKKENRSLNEQLQEDLDDYTAPVSSDLSGKLQMNLLNNSPQRQQTPVNIKEYETMGYKNTIVYLNSFILSLKTPNSENRLNVYTSLTNVLKAEQKIKVNKNALKAYQQGCMRAEKEMFDKLKR